MTYFFLHFLFIFTYASVVIFHTDDRCQFQRILPEEDENS